MAAGEIICGAGDTESRLFRIGSGELGAQIQIYGGGGADTCELHISPDGELGTAHQYNINSVAITLGEATTNSRAIDNFGWYQIKTKSGGALVQLIKPSNMS